MPQAKRSRKSRDLIPVHPAAAAVDIGATIHVAAVGPERDNEPVRTFRTFTDGLHRLADWFAGCGIKTVVMESTGVYRNLEASVRSRDTDGAARCKRDVIEAGLN